MTRSSSVATLSALFLVLGMVMAAPAFATTCTIQSDGVTMDISVDSAGAKIVRGADDTIVVTTSSGSTDLCGTDFHTVFDINSINISGTGAVALDLSGGDFAPGFSTETGTDEIEFYLGTGIGLTIQGTPGADEWTFGAGGIGLNSDSDADVLGGTSASPSATLTVVSVVANGLAGDDTFVQTSKATETLNGGDDTDAVDYSSRTIALAVTIGAGANDGESGENDNVGADVETVIGGSAADVISAPTTSMVKFRLEGGAGGDTLTGGAARDSLLGDAGADTLNGGDGRDLLNGGADADTENGQGGSDVFDQERESNGGDTLNGGEDSDGKDVDAVKYSLRNTGVRVTVGDADGDGACTACATSATEGDNVGGDVELVYGGKGDDHLIAKDGAGYRLSGGAGADTLTGKNGKDRLIGGAGADQLIGGGDADYLSGGSENDTLVGGAGDDNLAGGSGNDSMNGEAGTDRVSGSSGNDKLWGDGSEPFVKDTLVGGSQLTGGSDLCERDLKDVKSGCEGRTTGSAPVSP